MISSMTGFARVEHDGELGRLILELRSVNHRFLDVGLRLPDECRGFEQKIRERVSQRLSRGKVDCQLRYQRTLNATGEIQFDHELVGQIARASRAIDGILYDPSPVNSLDILRWPGVIQTPDLDLQRLQEEIMGLLDSALGELVEVRRREGDKIKLMLEERCRGIDSLLGEVGQAVPDIKAAWEKRLRERLAESEVELDESRLTQELVMMAQKMDIDEELDRLRAHLSEIQQVIGQAKPVGRKLDFLMQELNREANTIGSKSMAVVTSQASVELKVLIEQMREQVQNIE